MLNLKPDISIRVKHLAELYDSIFKWQTVYTTEKEQLVWKKCVHIDGAGMFIRRHKTVYRAQYGSVYKLTLPRIKDAKAVLSFIEAYFT